MKTVFSLYYIHNEHRIWIASFFSENDAVLMLEKYKKALPRNSYHLTAERPDEISF